MSLHDFRRCFLETRCGLSPRGTAAFSAMGVALGLIVSHALTLGLASGPLIVGVQSVTGINRKGPFHIRLGIAAQGGLALVLASCLGMLAGRAPLPIAILLGGVLAFGCAACRQRYPLNWQDIAIPAGVQFYMGYAHPAPAWAAVGAALGLLCELGLGLGILLKRRLSKVDPIIEDDLLPAPLPGDTKILGLPRYLFTYAVELTLLFGIGFVVMRRTSYPHAYWMPLTGLIVLKVGRSGTLGRVAERSLGTLGGCLLAGGLLYLQIGPVVSGLVMILCIFVWLSFLRVHYAVASIFITTFVLLMMGSGGPFSLEVVGERLVFTVAGGLLTLLVSRVFLEKRRR